MFLFSITEITSIILFGPFIKMLEGEEYINKLPYISDIYKKIKINYEDFILYFLIFLIVFIAFATFLNLYSNYKIKMFSMSFGYKLSNKIIEKEIRKKWIDFLKLDSTRIVKNATLEVNRVTNGVVLPIMHIITKIILVFVYLFMLYLYTGNFIFIVGSIILTIYFFIYFFIKKIFKFYGEKTSELLEIRNKVLFEIYNSFFEIALYRAYNFFLNRFNTAGDSLSKIQGISISIANSPRIIIEFLIIVGISIYIFFELFLNSNRSQLDIAFLAILGAAFVKLLPNIQQIFYCVSQIRLNINAFDVIKDSFITKDRPNSYNKKIIFKNLLELRDFSFSYDSDNFIFKKASFILPKGKKIGIRSKSGKGKSTLIKILTGMIKIDSGQCYVDGKLVNIFDNNYWKSKIAVVPQGISLINDSILNNILFEKRDSYYKKSIIEKVIKDSQLIDFLINNKINIDFQVGENGKNLSGGERQRVILARAFFKNADILIMDEPFSALDDLISRNIIKTIYKNYNDKIIIIISHKLKDLKFCDEIYTIKDKKIIKFNGK